MPVPEADAGFVPRWRPRADPLTPLAVAFAGPPARTVAHRLADGQRPTEGLRGLADGELLLLLGEADALPWAPGALYLGRDDAAPSLLLPTALEPTTAPGLFQTACLQRAGTASVMVLPPSFAAGPALVPLGEARPLSPAGLKRWLDSQQEPQG